MSTEDRRNSSKWPRWKELHRAALVELDEVRARELIGKARDAIIQRTDELRDNVDHQQEKMELRDALSSLRSLETY